MYAPDSSKSYQQQDEPHTRFHGKSLKVYSSCQIVIGLVVVILATFELLYSLEFRAVTACVEILGAVFFLVSGILGTNVWRTKRLSYTLACLVFCCFALICSFAIMVLYPVFLLSDKRNFDDGSGDHELYWFRIGCLGIGFFLAVVGWCITICQMVVCYWTIQFMIRRGYDGFSDPRAVHAHLIGACSVETSEETLLLAGRYDARPSISNADHSQQSQGVCAGSANPTTALITPSAPAIY